MLRLRISMRESVAFPDGRAGLNAADELQDAEYRVARRAPSREHFKRDSVRAARRCAARAAETSGYRGPEAARVARLSAGARAHGI